MGSYNLFLDDERQPLTVFNMTGNRIYLDEKWSVARNYDSFCFLLKANHFHGNIPKIISLDHDLADEHYKHGSKSGFKEFHYSEVTEKTGLHCAKFMCDYFFENKIAFPEILVHSMNPIGKENIIGYINSFKQHHK